MDKSERYNLVVVGAGAAGLVSAYIAAAVKAKVALIERHKMGGDCLNFGCVPSKALLRTAKFVAEMRNHKMYGVKNVQFEMDFRDVMARVHRIIGKIEPHDSIERYTDLGVECITGQAELIDSQTVKVGERILHAKNIVLALGASPLIPPLIGLDKISYRTSENLWEMQELPKRLVVLGGGPIGCEMVQAFQRLGSQVTQVEMGERLLPREDADVATFVAELFKREGVTLHVGTKATEVRVENGTKYLLAHQAGREVKIAFDEILIAVGRKANTSGVDWSKLGIELNQNGTFKVDPYLRVNGSNIFACGDCVGPFQFTHVSSHQAWFCAVNALFSPFKRFKVDYRVIPWVTFTDPEVARVGLSETDAKSLGIPVEVTRYEIDDLDRAIADDADHGFVKVLMKPGSGQILGATIVGHLGGELITEFVTAMKHGLGLGKILGTIHSYPTMAEANKYAAGVWKKKTAPAWAMPILAKFHAWRR